MTAYLQMGHQSESLMSYEEPALSPFGGAILSPVNSTKEQVRSQIINAPRGFDMVFDPQLYFPQSERKILRTWSYYPSDVGTADPDSLNWWEYQVEELVACTVVVRPSTVCSPAKVPSVFPDGYYELCVSVGGLLADSLHGSGIRPIQTAIVSLADLTMPNRALEIAAILSGSQADEIYVVFVGDTEPRRELGTTEELKGAMRLIQALKTSGLTIIVPFCSSDLILWKAAGASICATGKFFNLRRFTRSRFDEPSEGGQQIPYWFEESLLAFLRVTDVLRVGAKGFLGRQALENPFSQQILEQFAGTPERAWLALSWRQYLFSFMDLERRLSTGESDPVELVRTAERNWIALEDAKIYMEERRNNGDWLRAWLRALVEYRDV